MRHATSLLLLLFLTTACPSRPSEGAQANVDPNAPASATQAASAMPSAPTAAPGPVRLSQLPARFRDLGGKCPETNDHETNFCDSQGKVTGIWAMVDTVSGVPPAGAEEVRNEPRLAFMPSRSLVVALEGDRLWIKLVTCGACRRIMGWSFVGNLTTLTDAQLRVTQARIGLEESLPALRTPAAWRAVYRHRPLPKLPDAAAPLSDAAP